ncbi:hypothetical protein R4Z10_19465 [Niallia sp. XMNu-256]|uniref:hypothetical protein n=1 Tax=Niallia sp. XMNu-256 TaxID=3082444 RepID=UPI0030CA728D
MKMSPLFVVMTLIVTLIFIPIIFNIFFLWDSGYARGKTSDWFTLYGNIFGGLIGGFFTFIALMLTFRWEGEKQKELDNKYQNRMVKNYVINNRYYFNKLEGELLKIRSVIDDEYQKELISVASSINFQKSSYKEHGYYLDNSKIEIKKYEFILKNIGNISSEYQLFLKNNLTEFANLQEYYDDALNLYLMINFLHDDIDYALKSDYYKDLDFLYNFINHDDTGYSVIIRLLRDHILAMWESQISDNHIASWMQENSIPHIKG